MADKLRTQQQLEQLQSRYVGTGHADTTKFEWTSNIHRDSYASYVGHPPLLEYMAIGMGEPKERVRAMMIEKMIQPVGKPPEVATGVAGEMGQNADLFTGSRLKLALRMGGVGLQIISFSIPSRYLIQTVAIPVIDLSILLASL
ncbi:hypothetical protein MMC24_003155 [Lignoscripta atroalba]|nr:hypothetical protein [Lignoscripta atroalba]